MSLITNTQAEALYNNAVIEKITLDSDPTKGNWTIVSVLDGHDYTFPSDNIVADQDLLPMDASLQEIKDKFIEIAITKEYKGIKETYTKSIVGKV